MEPKVQTSDDTLFIVANENELTPFEKVDALEAVLRTMEPADLPVTNYFSKGVYARQLVIPKGTTITGKIHKYENLNIVSKGDISVMMEDGSVKRITAPFTIVSPPGTRRAAYAHEETVWTTIHGTDSKDVEEIESIFIAQTPDEYALFCETVLKIGD